MRFNPGQVIGGWTLTRELGKGGNGLVFEATKDGRVAALKILHASRNSQRLARFNDEIRAIEKCSGLPGVLPLLDSHLQHASNDIPPWFAMAIAIPLLDALGASPNLEQVVIAIRGVAATLTSVHELGLSHRDIKPDNLFWLEGTWAIGDFGLADFDGKESETAPLERLGPIYYIAPEMLNNASNADGKLADVYSLAKTLWVLGTGQKYPLPGHLVASNTSIAMSSFSAHPRASLLDKLVDAATCYEPTTRPTMRQFLGELDAWLTPPATSPTNIRPNVARFKHLLEGRIAKLEANNREVELLNQRRNDEGLRMRELFRPIACELQETLKEAGLIHTSLQIDNYHYGFEARGVVPNNPHETIIHSIRITVHTGMNDPAAQRCSLNAWYRHVLAGSTQSTETVLWEAERTFLAGGSEENGQVSAMIQDLREQLYNAITTILMAAEIIGDS